MRLETAITQTKWEMLFYNTITYREPEAVKSLANNLYLKWYYRTVRGNFNLASLDEFVRDWLVTHKQKIFYILDTATEDFLKTTSTSDNTYSGEATDYNVDYFGGEGRRGRDSDSNRSQNTVISIDSKNKMWNFSSIIENRLFYQLANTLFETFEFPEELEW